MRKRPLCIATMCYIIGIIMGLYLQISIVFLLCISVIMFFLEYFIFHKPKDILFILVILLGFISIKMVDNDYKEQYCSLNEQEEYKIQAIIVSDTVEKEYKNVYEIEVQTINGNKEYEGKKWLLNAKKSKNIDNKTQEDLQFGDLIEFYGTIEIPSTARNYMGFDYEQYLKSQKIYGNITAKNKVDVIEKSQGKFLGTVWHCVSINIKEKVYQLLPEDAREVCVGILLGDRDDISEEITDDFQESNLTHMLAVSGAHISYIILGLTFLLHKTKYRFRKIFTIIFLCFFMGLTGFTPSVQRASLMAIFILIGDLIHRKTDVYTNLSISSLFILICNPYAILNIGFQLSYGGTIGIVIFHKKIINSKLLSKNSTDSNIVADKKESGLLNNKKKSMVRERKINIFQRLAKYAIEVVTVSISANLVIIPIMAFQFNRVSFTFWFSNLLAGQLLGIITILGFILYFISIFSMKIAIIVAVPLKYLIYLLISIAKFCSKIPFSSVIVRTPYLFEIFFYYLIIFIICNLPYCKEKVVQLAKILIKKINEVKINKIKFRFIKIISIVLVFMIILSFGIRTCKGHQELKIYFIDVGQGDCALICTPTNKTILIDGGGSETGTFDVGEKTLLPYLLDRKITKLDYVLISHFDTDHVGGLFYVLENIKIGHIIISKQGELSENYKKFKELVVEKNISVIVVRQGDRVQIDKFTYLDVLFPEENMISNNILNNNSIVAKLNYGNFSCAFTGDIEEIAEKRLVEKYSGTDTLNATVLKVAHHRFKKFFNSRVSKFSTSQNCTYWSRSKKHLRTSK